MAEETENSSVNFQFAAVVTARLTSNFGSFLSMIALNIYMLEISKSVKWTGLAMAVRVLSGIASAPFVGHAVDTMNRKRLMVISDIILFASMLGLVFVPPAFAKPYIVGLMVVIGVFSSLFDVALSAATPSILGTKDTLRANSWFIGGRNLILAGSGLCAVAAGYIFKGYNAIFVIDALTYLLSAGVLAALTIRTAEAAKAKPAKLGVLAQVRAGLDEIRGLPNAKTILLFLSILLLDAFASASHNIGWPVFSESMDAAKPMFYYGVILFFYAWGNVLGIYQLNRLAFIKKLRPETLYMLFTAIMSAGMILTFQTRTPWFIALAAFIAGVGDGTYQTYLTTYLQQAPDNARGKIFALTGLAMRTGFSLGFVAVPLVLEQIPLAATAALFHGSVLAALVVSALALYSGKPAQALTSEPAA